MTSTHTDRIYRKILNGERLTRDEDRHIAGCADCQRATLDAERLDDRLREAAGFLALEPIPDEVLTIEPMRPAAAARFPLLPTVMAAAAVMAAVIVGLTLTQLRPPAAVQPLPSASASVGQSEGPSVSPSASPTPTSPPSPPPPIASDVDPHLVGPFSSCSDGTVGFSVFLPDAWYANRRIGDSPACQTVGHVRNVEGSQVLDPEIYLNVQPDPPAFSDAEIEEQEEIQLTNGIVLQRYVTSIAESGAVAASRGVTYVAPLLGVESSGPGGYLVAATDANNEDSVAGLDALMERFELHESLTADATAVAAARDLFMDRDVCLDAERGLGVVSPMRGGRTPR